MDEGEIDCFAIENHTVISFIYGKLGVYFLCERMCVCMDGCEGHCAFIPGSLKDL